MKSYRLARVASVLREVAAETILWELRDPRVKNVTVTRAEVSGDLQHAKVFVSIMGSERDQKLAIHGLTSAAGFVQTKLAKRLTSRYVPHVSFVLDDGIKKSIEIARLLRQEQGESAGEDAYLVDDEVAIVDDSTEDNDLEDQVGPLDEPPTAAGEKPPTTAGDPPHTP